MADTFRKITQTPSEVDPGQDRFNRRVRSEFNQMPHFSIFSTSDGPNTSGVSAVRGTIGVEVGSGSTTFWGCTSEGTNNWTELE